MPPKRKAAAAKADSTAADNDNEIVKSKPNKKNAAKDALTNGEVSPANSKDKTKKTKSSDNLQNGDTSHNDTSADDVPMSPPTKKSKKNEAGKAEPVKMTNGHAAHETEPKRKRGAKQPATIPEDEAMDVETGKYTSSICPILNHSS